MLHIQPNPWLIEVYELEAGDGFEDAACRLGDTGHAGMLVETDTRFLTGFTISRRRSSSIGHDGIDVLHQLETLEQIRSLDAHKENG